MPDPPCHPPWQTIASELSDGHPFAVPKDFNFADDETWMAYSHPQYNKSDQTAYDEARNLTLTRTIFSTSLLFEVLNSKYGMIAASHHAGTTLLLATNA